MNAYQLLRHYSIIYIGIFVFLLCLGREAYSQHKTSEVVTQAQKDIVGTWISAEGGNTKWVITESHIKTYYKNQLDDTYSYRISRESNHCGYDVSKRLEKYSWQSILTLSKTQSNTEKCYYIYGISNNHLSLSPFGYASFLSFEKNSNR